MNASEEGMLMIACLPLNDPLCNTHFMASVKAFIRSAPLVSALTDRGADPAANSSNDSWTDLNWAIRSTLQPRSTPIGNDFPRVIFMPICYSNASCVKTHTSRAHGAFLAPSRGCETTLLQIFRLIPTKCLSARLI